MRLFLLFILAFISQKMFAQNIGVGTTAPHASSLVHIDAKDSIHKGLLVTGTFNENSTVPNLGSGSRMMFYPGKAAFRAGYAESNSWDNSKVGTHSVALGYINIASGYGSFAAGFVTEASGDQSTSFGIATRATNTYATAFGNSTVASGISSFAAGELTDATGYTATSFGRNTLASGASSFATGRQTVANGEYSSSFGYKTNALGFATAAFGQNNRTTGTNSFSTGLNNVAKGHSSTVVGMFNDSLLATDQTINITPTNPLFIVGNGSSDASRSNALVVRKNGNVEVENLIIGGGTTISRKLAGSATVGSNPTNFKTFTVNFPVAFTNPPKVIATTRNQAGTDYPDTFVVTVRSVSTTQVVFNILRVDTNALWAQSLQLDWIAWE